ncbi:uncharacterized protein MELLADRAFT_86141 [Melampsora larici-populina 98AG31]|uniref:Uncharacterized protein n=1 Tax=Melampsora larici-populina (strain 98AG31 / pathotype 3-4-7) TaxID=747676 RepID=F4RLF3_MELLP|nr:uncharacterized protein MELLADRAFT_86141 [Melampsora larici-populina 98AG31]EGG07006.1 hypothetical protein MELLADRAFT_86141 [Melampsora larici-populina 98AG31]
MFSDKPPDSILSFRDMPPHRSEVNPQASSASRLLYKPSYDLQFDLEMAQRRSEKEPRQDELPHPPLSYDDEGQEGDDTSNGLEPNGVEFGSKLETENVFDEETLNSLLLPPSPEYTPGLERELRPNAIFLYNRSVGLLKTEQIISHIIQMVKTRELNFEHLEWIDDFSCVLAFKDKSAAIEAFTTLLLKPDEVEGENGLAEAIDFLSCVPSRPTQDVLAAAADFVFALRPSKPLASSLFETNKPNPLLQPTRPEQLVPFIRFATSLDVKRVRARDHSLFYVLHGDRAGRDGVSTQKASSSFHQSSKRRRVDNPSSRRPGPDDETWSRNRPIARLPSDRRDGRSRHRGAATAADLDDELDRFMCQASTSNDQDGINDHDDGRPGSDDEDSHQRRSKRHEPEREQFSKEDLFPRSRLGAGGGNLNDEVSEDKERQRTPPEDGLRTWIVQADGQTNEEELGEDEELVDEYVEMIDEETGKKIKRLTQSRRRKSRSSGNKGRGSSFGRLFGSSIGRLL